MMVFLYFSYKKRQYHCIIFVERIMRIGMMTQTYKRFMSQEKSLRYIKEFGFDVADITLFADDDVSKPDPDIFSGDYIQRAHQIREYADKINLPIVQAHAPFPVHKDGDEEYDKMMFDIFIKCFEVCGILGVNNLVIHPWNKWNYKENAVFFKKLLPYAKQNKVVICTENMWNWDHQNEHAIEAACSSPEDFLKHVEEVNDDYLQACVDVGHANMMSMVSKATTPGNMVRVLNKHVKCFHVHDNDGIHDCHVAPFTMSLDWNDLAKAIAEIHYDDDIILEVCDFKPLSLKETLQRNRLLVDVAKRLCSLIEEYKKG